MSRLLRSLFVGVVAGVALLSSAPAASAHPLGNFTTNRFSGLEISTDEVHIHYAIDMAEIPTLQELQELGSSEEISAARLRTYANDLAGRLLSNLQLEADGESVALSLLSSSAKLSDGQSGLNVLRIDADFTGELPGAAASIEFQDRNYASRRGWKEIVAYTSDGQGIVSSSVPESSISNELRSYSKDLLSSPPDVSSASIEVRPGATGSGVTAGGGATEGGTDQVGEWFSSLIERDLSPAFFLVAVLIALLAGALHALQPGHGKTILAAYLVGGEGKVRHAMTLGIAVSMMHTTSVVVLGLITLWASNVFSPDAVYPWLSLFSGVVVLLLGAWLFAQRTGHLPPGRVHDHPHLHTPARLDDGHTHGRGLFSHSHALPVGVSPFTAKGMAAVALSGGLLPSPAALIVLLGAVALHRVAFGVVLVAAFSIGLAAALTGVGLLVIKARGFAERRLNARTSAALPVASAALILLFGLVLTVRAIPGL